MLRKLKHVMHIVIGSSFGVCLGNILFVLFDYIKYPAIYELRSESVSTIIIRMSVCYGIILLVEIAIHFFVCHRIKKVKVDDVS